MDLAKIKLDEYVRNKTRGGEVAMRQRAFSSTSLPQSSHEVPTARPMQLTLASSTSHPTPHSYLMNRPRYSMQDIYKENQSFHALSPLQQPVHREVGRNTSGSSGSVHIGIARPFQQLRDPYNPREPRKRLHQHSLPTIMTPNIKKKMLTYEKVPGRKGGQTRLTFY
uniref:Uncharacterized protein n=1 Tax=Ciona savignyi TaxID=51511 RepID=H2YAC0_CIOSA